MRTDKIIFVVFWSKVLRFILNLSQFDLTNVHYVKKRTQNGSMRVEAYDEITIDLVNYLISRRRCNWPWHIYYSAFESIFVKMTVRSGESLINDSYWLLSVWNGVWIQTFQPFVALSHAPITLCLRPNTIFMHYNNVNKHTY